MKATKKGFRHRVNPAGTKLLKKAYRREDNKVINDFLDDRVQLESDLEWLNCELEKYKCVEGRLRLDKMIMEANPIIEINPNIE